MTEEMKSHESRISISIYEEEIDSAGVNLVQSQKIFFENYFLTWFETLKIPFQGEISLLFCGDETMQALNKQYRAKDRTTDVLSFPMMEDWVNGQGVSVQSMAEPLGDIIVNMEQIRRQHEQWHNTPDQEMTRLLAHGLLHLIGYDHERDAESEKLMTQKEKELLQSIEKF